jgi:hypothetical protein
MDTMAARLAQGEFWDPLGELTQLWNYMGQLLESGGQGAPRVDARRGN